MSLTIADLEKLQAEHPNWRMELVDGSIVVMEPSDYESDEISIRFAAKLSLPDLLPGWELAISELWSPEFE